MRQFAISFAVGLCVAWVANLRLPSSEPAWARDMSMTEH